MSRKRTRSQAFAEEHEEDTLHAELDLGSAEREETEEEKEAKREKQLEIWESVKEEYFEGECHSI